MDKLKVAVVGVGSIAQVVHLPILKKNEDVEVVAICDVDESKVTPLLDKFKVPRWYKQVDNLLKTEKLDIVHICTSNLYHYPMAYLALKKDMNVFLEKPIALNATDAENLDKLARERNLQVLVGMHNRFREDVQILKEFLANDELGEIFYIKSGTLKKYSRNPYNTWQTNKSKAGGGVLIDLGTQLIDLAMFLMNMPKIKSVRLFEYKINPKLEVEDSALAVIETQDGLSLTIETSWKMHMEKDIHYTHIFGNKGSAYLDPLRINKELHGNLVNVTPVTNDNSAMRYKKAYEAEIRHFVNVVKGVEENKSSATDAVRVMRIIDALYQSGKTRQQIELNE